MKVFISWSGQLSHKVACAFREWLPSVIQSVSPYVSSEDIDKGTRWSTDIANELEESKYGIICVTKDNVNAPWISFEAGALSKKIDKSYVSPFLFDLKRSDVQGPLLQFQSCIYDREDVFKLVKSINKRIDEVNRLSDEHLQRAFNVWWPQLDKSLKEIPVVPSPQKAQVENEGKTSEILEELLELARNQQRLLSDPESILPPRYIEHVMGRSRSYRGTPRGYSVSDFSDLEELVHEKLLRLESLLREECDGEEAVDRIEMALSLVKEIRGFFHELLRKSKRRFPEARRVGGARIHNEKESGE